MRNIILYIIHCSIWLLTPTLALAKDPLKVDAKVTVPSNTKVTVPKKVPKLDIPFPELHVNLYKEGSNDPIVPKDPKTSFKMKPTEKYVLFVYVPHKSSKAATADTLTASLSGSNSCGINKGSTVYGPGGLDGGPIYSINKFIQGSPTYWGGPDEDLIISFPISADDLAQCKVHKTDEDLQKPYFDSLHLSVKITAVGITGLKTEQELDFDIK